MKTLVLNIDRDDDFGRKAKVKSPIIGYANNLEAANKLGQEDPEDSDLNAIFYAISTYNKLKKEGKKVEIATICGHINVGFKSDEIIAEQLEEVIAKTKAYDVILISDGAEDEYILPIIQSRIKITSVSRVSVKQSRELEDTYYRFMKILDDDKVKKQFILPVALVFIVWAIFTLIGIAAAGFILLTLGVYLLIRAFSWEKNISLMSEDIKSGFLTGKLSIYTYIVSIIVLLAFGIYAYTSTNFQTEFIFLPIISFVFYMVWGIVFAGWLIVFGRAVDTYVHHKKIPLTYYMTPFSLLAFGFVSHGGLGALKDAIANPAEFSFAPFENAQFILYMFSGILVLVIGAIIHHFKKENNHYDEAEKDKGKVPNKS